MGAVCFSLSSGHPCFVCFTTLDGCHLLLIVTWPSLFIVFSTPDGCRLFADCHLGIAGFFFTTLDGCCLFPIPHAQHNVAWHGHPHPKQYTFSNARDILIANASQCIVCGHHCLAANVRNLAATAIPPSLSCVVHHGPCPKATPHPPPPPPPPPRPPPPPCLGKVVENRHTAELKVVAPGLLEKIQLYEVRNNNVFK